jgi:hypothetical protein
MGLPLDPMDFHKWIKAAGIPVYSSVVEAALSGSHKKSDARNAID